MAPNLYLVNLTTLTAPLWSAILSADCAAATPHPLSIRFQSKVRYCQGQLKKNKKFLLENQIYQLYFHMLLLVERREAAGQVEAGRKLQQMIFQWGNVTGISLVSHRLKVTRLGRLSDLQLQGAVIQMQ